MKDRGKRASMILIGQVMDNGDGSLMIYPRRTAAPVGHFSSVIDQPHGITASPSISDEIFSPQRTKRSVVRAGQCQQRAEAESSVGPSYSWKRTIHMNAKLDKMTKSAKSQAEETQRGHRREYHRGNDPG